MKRELIDVHPGQVWRDRDVRMKGRRVLVTKTSLEDLQAYVYYRQVVGLDSDQVGQIFRSRYERFQRSFDRVGVANH